VDAQCSKRFSAYGWLKKHILKDHKVDLPELSQEQEAANKRLMQQQRNFKAGVVGVIEGDAAEVAEERECDEHECGICGYKTSAGENFVTLSHMLQAYFLHAACPNNVTMTDHYILCHLPRYVASAYVYSNTVTGEVVKGENYELFEHNPSADDDVLESLFDFALGGFIADRDAFFLCLEVIVEDKQCHGEIDLVRNTPPPAIFV
jgi:hypothetical protein